MMVAYKVAKSHLGSRTCWARLHGRCDRRGAVAVLMAFLMVILIGCVAFALDIGYISMTRTQLQAASDSSSLGGGTELLPGLGFNRTKTAEQVSSAAKTQAVLLAAANPAGDVAAAYADSERDVLLRTVWQNEDGTWSTSAPGVIERHNGYNAVSVTLLRNQAGGANGDHSLPLFFAPVLGTQVSNLTAQATAAILPARGFRFDPAGPNPGLTPFAIGKDPWYRRMDAQKWLDTVGGGILANINPNITYVGTGDPSGAPVTYSAANPLFYSFDSAGLLVQDINDQYTYEPNFGNVANGLPTPGVDGILEILMFPTNNLTAGNFGTITLSATNGTQDLARIITEGPNESDWAYMQSQGIVDADGNLIVGGGGTFDASGNTGLSSGMKTALAGIIDEPRSGLLFSTVASPGNNAVFSIVDVAGFVVLDIKLSPPKGKKPGEGEDIEGIVIQPTNVIDPNAVPDYSGTISESTTMFTPLILID